MAKKLFLEKNIKILKNKSDKTKGDILRFIDLISYLAVKKEISLDDAERHTYTLFKMLEEARES
jgi:hypothetical protein